MIHWLVQSASSLPDPLPPGVLSGGEAATLAGLVLPKRRADWLLGRLTAKQLVQSYLQKADQGTPPLDAIAIAADPNGAPYAGLHGARLPLSLSISHSHGTAFCALVDAAGGASLGCDIEQIERRDAAFGRDFFTTHEQAQAATAPDPDAALTALWSAKEAVLKALREGLRLDTRQVEIALPAVLSEEWSPLAVALDAELAARFPGVWSAWVRRHAGFMLTLALCA